MIKFTLGEMLEKRGLTAYALHNKSDKKLHQSVIGKIKNNESKALNLDTLDMICELLECQPADLIIYVSENATQSAKVNVARATQNAKHTQTGKALDSSGIPELPVLDAKTDYWMSTRHISEVVGRESRTVRDFYKQGLPFTKTTKGNFVKFTDYSIFMQNRNQNQK